MAFYRKVSGLLVFSQLLFFASGSTASGSSASQDLNSIENTSSEERQIKTVASSDIIQEDMSSDGSATKNDRNLTTASSEINTPIINESETARSVEESQELSETTEESEDRVSTFAIGTQASGSGMTDADPRIVENSEELQTAIETDRVNYIKFAPAPESEPDKIFEFTASRRMRIYNDLTIDGNGRTVSYAQRSGNNAMEVYETGLTVKFKDITFGSPDFSVPTDEYYGFCRGNGRANTTIEVENVNYYSNRGAQPFHNAASGSKVVFYGVNNFVMRSGSLTQEFAECNSFIFEENSQTTVSHETSQTNSIVTSGSGFLFELKDGAAVDYTTSSSFIDNIASSGRGSILVGKEANLKINGNKGFISLSRSFDFDVSENGKLDLSFANKFNLNNSSTFNLAKESILAMAVTNSDQIFNNRLAPENFVVDNAYRMTFDVSNTSNKEPINSGFTFKPFIADVTSYGITANNNPVNTTISELDTITSNVTNFILANASTSRADFTDDEKSTIRGATHLVFQRLPNPSIILNVKKVVRDTKAEFNLSDYLGNSNKLKNVVYRLYSKPKTSKELTDEDDTGFIADKKVDSEPLTSVVMFDDLTDEKEYWLYVQLQAEFSSGDSEWFEVPFKTKSSVLSVSIPTSMFFTTEMDEYGKLNIQSPSYGVKNNSAYPITVDLASFEEKGKSDIELLDTEEPDNSKGLLLKLTKNREPLTTLKTDLSDVPISKLDTDERNELRFTGEYYGSGGKEINVNYMMTLNFKKAED